jgi:hypothetical protein
MASAAPVSADEPAPAKKMRRNAKAAQATQQSEAVQSGRPAPGTASASKGKNSQSAHPPSAAAAAAASAAANEGAASAPVPAPLPLSSVGAEAAPSSGSKQRQPGEADHESASARTLRLSARSRDQQLSSAQQVFTDMAHAWLAASSPSSELPPDRYGAIISAAWKSAEEKGAPLTSLVRTLESRPTHKSPCASLSDSGDRTMMAGRGDHAPRRTGGLSVSLTESHSRVVTL